MGNDKKVVKSESQLDVVNNNEALRKMYQDNANLGSENLGGVSPLLKIHATGRSTTNQLADGSEPKDGYFFYRPTGEQFEVVEAHILTISRGFRTDGLQKTNVFNQIMAGVIVNDNKPRPFMMYLTGLKLSPMWDFGKEAGKYTHAKPFPIPMFALKVKLSSVKVKTDFGTAWTLKFDIQKDEGGNPVIVTDEKVFTYLKAQVTKIGDTISKIVEAKAPEQAVEDEPLEVLPEEEPVADKEPKKAELKENVNPDDIPF